MVMATERKVEERIAKITQAFLGWEDHGILTAMLTLNYGHGSVQGAGGYALDRWDEEQQVRVGTEFGMSFIIQLMRACGVTQWGDLVGTTVFAIIDVEKRQVIGVKNLPTEPGEYFLFDLLATQYRDDG